MEAVRLSRRMTLEAPIRTPDGAGGYVESWAPLGEVWADVSARAGRERAEGLAPVSAVSYRIVVRAAPPGSPARPQARQRLVEGQRRFLIQAVADWGSAGRYLVCFADEEVAA